MQLLSPLVHTETRPFFEEHVSPVSIGPLLNADCVRTVYLLAFRVGNLLFVTFMNVETIPHGTTGTIGGKATFLERHTTWKRVGNEHTHLLLVSSLKCLLTKLRQRREPASKYDRILRMISGGSLFNVGR